MPCAELARAGLSDLWRQRGKAEFLTGSHLAPGHNRHTCSNYVSSSPSEEEAPGRPDLQHPS